ncbi:glycosyltransferase, partial [Clavibacter michiganensis]|uniref:glycosyltransferase n=1 Tax=Clavibacter michiganensis TaxID=28447 RepID=UPI001F4E5D86
MRIAMISEHASPLATLGGVDAGGQNVHVAALSAALAEEGHTVTVYTRRDDAALPARVAFAPGVEVVHLDAGPARAVPKDELLPHMGELADGLLADWRTARPDVVQVVLAVGRACAAVGHGQLTRPSPSRAPCTRPAASGAFGLFQYL